MQKLTKREISNRNEFDVLHALYRFGWLRTRDLAVIVWMRKQKRNRSLDLTPIYVSETAMRMAQKTLAKLRDNKQVNFMNAPDTSVVYGLAEAGARRLKNHGIGDAHSGEDILKRISLSFFHHRRICNEIAILGMKQGFKVHTEAEISAGKWFGGIKGIHSKKPDVLLQGDHNLWVWIEVERSRRNAKDYTKLLDFLKAAWPAHRNIYTSAPLTADEKMVKVHFICEPTFIEKVSKDLMESGWASEIVEHRIKADTMPYVTNAKYLLRDK